MNRKTLLTWLLLFAVLPLLAQGLVMQSFEERPTDLTANTPGTIVTDQNGRKCALIKVESTLSDLTFEAGMLGVRKAEQHTGEWWVYVPDGVKRLSIFHPQLGVLRDQDLGQSVRQGCTYLLRLVAGEVQTVVRQTRTSQYVVFQVEPKNAVVFLDGEMLSTTDGTASKLLRFGNYSYRVQAPDYQSDAGYITVNDPKQKHVVNIRLKPNFAQVTLTVDGNAEIWVNGQRKGQGRWQGNLGAGTYEIETRLAGHRTRTTTRDIAAGTDPVTIRLDAPTPIYGEADISSTPAMADIFIDGRKVGQTPQLISDLLVGQHSLRLTRQGYQDYTATITIREGETESHSTTLKQQASQPIANSPADQATLKEWFDKGYDYYNGINGKPKDYAEAVKWYRKAAEQGYASAQCNLGLCYERGEGVTKDYAEAVKWYRKAAEQGNTQAQCNLGWCYESGIGVSKDYAEAVKWYRKAAEQGHNRAQCNLGWCYESGHGVTKSFSEAVKWYRKAAEQGYDRAQCNLGWCYESGQGVTKSYSEAVKLYRKAAEQGYDRAQCNLGWCYESGIGVTKDYAEAVKWYRKAAEQGYARAQYNLGKCYENGRGVTQNYAEAVKWYRKAAGQNYDGAKNALDRLKHKGYH